MLTNFHYKKYNYNENIYILKKIKVIHTWKGNKMFRKFQTYFVKH